MPAALAKNSRPRLPLTDLPAGARGRVTQLTAAAEACQRLREMGFCESAVIERVAGKRMLICQLCGTRISLSDRAARHILVEHIRSGPG